MNRHGLDLTEGRVSTLLLRFAAPFLVTSLMQTLHGLINMFVVGQFASSAAVSAVATGSNIIQVIFALNIGLSMGNTVLVGHNIGEKNATGAAKAVGSIFSLGIILAVILTPTMILLSATAVSWMQTPPEAVEYAREFVAVISCAIPFIVGFNALSSIFRGMGNSKTPSIIAAIGCAVNIAADFVLIGAFGLGAKGAAIGTIISQFCNFSAAALYMYKKRFPFPFTKKDFGLHSASFRYILRVGSPLALQETLVTFSFMIIMALINTLGVTVSAAVGVVQRIFGIAALVPSCFGSGVAAITAQNLGAGKPDRAKKSLRWGITFSLIFGAVMFLYSQFWPATLTGIFSNDQAVVQAGAEYLRAFTIDCMLIAVIFCMNSYFSGCGKSVISMIHSLIATFGVRVPYMFIVIHGPGVTLYKLGLAAPVASSLSLIILFAYFFWQNRAEKKRLKAAETAEAMTVKKI